MREWDESFLDVCCGRVRARVCEGWVSEGECATVFKVFFILAAPASCVDGCVI